MIVEDDALLRTSLVAALPLQGIDVVGSADGASGALELIRRVQPDAALLDLDLGVGPNGIDIARLLRVEYPAMGLVVLTGYADPRLAGASSAQLPEDVEYVVKSRLPDAALLGRILARSAARRTGQVSDLPAPLAPHAPHDLTQVQLEVLRLVARGMSNAEIAAARSVSEKAVENTITRLCRRLGIASDAGSNARVLLTRYYFTMSGSGA